MPSARLRGRYFAAPEIAVMRLLLELHEQAGCELPTCPVPEFAAFFAELEQRITGLGEQGRAQLWASLAILPPRSLPVGKLGEN